jgi:hypothetical protein
MSQHPTNRIHTAVAISSERAGGFRKAAAETDSRKNHRRIDFTILNAGNFLTIFNKLL